jgi:hypothetical protein
MQRLNTDERHVEATTGVEGILDALSIALQSFESFYGLPNY